MMIKSRSVVYYKSTFQSFYRRDIKGYHRGNDLPAYITRDGTQLWYFYGELHRENNPAVIRSNGIVDWFQYGQYWDPLEEQC